MRQIVQLQRGHFICVQTAGPSARMIIYFIKSSVLMKTSLMYYGKQRQSSSLMMFGLKQRHISGIN